MRGFTPKLARAGGISLLLTVCGCAHAAPPVSANRSANDGELARLQRELAARDQQIAQLEGRLALAEAGQRQLRDELERRDVAAPRETVRIGKQQQPEPEAPPPPPVERRPVLVLHNDRAPRSYAHDSELASTWQPPATNERLSVVPLPDAPAAKKPAAAAAPAPSPEPVEDLYLRGLDLLRRHEFAEAQREFDAFVSARPRDPRVGKAHFFRAELAYAERDYKRALAAYEQSLSADPLGDKAPDAMLRSALCQLSLGAREKARAILNSLRAKFPDSEAARKSAQVMQEDSG